MKVTLVFKDSSKPLITDADDLYTKGKMLCVRVGDNVTKYPIQNIHSVSHAYKWEDAKEGGDA